MSYRNLSRILINTGIGLVLILLWLKLVDVQAVATRLTEVSLTVVIPFLAFFALANLLRAIRLKVLLKKFQLPLINLYFLNHLSQLFSYTIPLRVGELSKAVYLANQFQLPIGKSVIWIFLDRFLDFFMVLIIAAVLMVGVPTKLPTNFQQILAIIIALITMVVGLVVWSPSLAKQLAKLVSHLLIFGWLKKYFVQASHFLIDASSLLRKNPYETAQLIGLTILALIADAFVWYFLFEAVGLPVAFLRLWLGSLLSMLTYLIPAAPGYVGSAEASGLAVFGFGLGLDATLTSAATVLQHILTLVVVLILGLISLYLLKFDLKLVWQKLKKA